MPSKMWIATVIYEFVVRPLRRMDWKSWHKKPLGVLLLYTFVALLAWWNIHIPSPGKSVAALAVAAAVMAFIGDMGGREKAAWILILFGFLGVELKSIDMERKAQEDMQSVAHAEQLQHFKDIGVGITDSVERNEKHFSETMSKVNKNIQIATGGSSFCYVDFTHFVFGPRLVATGKYPLHAVVATVKDFDAMERLFNEQRLRNFADIQRDYNTFAEVTISIGEVAGGQASQVAQVPILRANQEREIDIFFPLQMDIGINTLVLEE